MRVCVIGSGGREHALASALARSSDVVVCPGNPGIEAAGLACTVQAPESISADLFVIGPESPLVEGLADRLRAHGRLVFGPGADGARLEGSKAWMKEVLVEAGVPTAAHRSFEAAEQEEALGYLRELSGPYVVKTDGLAAGKGVLVTDDRDEAADDVRAKLSGSSFGHAGLRVVIEEGLTGEELSVMAVCDGTRAVALAAAQDFKRIGDGDTGPNTGGMGAYSPLPWAPDSLVDEVMDRAVEPTLVALAKRDIDYRGVLYAGVMQTASGPRILEFNVRFGDPEAQVVLPRWDGDVAAVLAAAAAGDLASAPAPTFGDGAAVCVVLAAEGYPGSPRVGDVIDGLDEVQGIEGIEVFFAGVADSGDGRLRTAGGRVLAVTAVGSSIGAARRRAYDAAGRISWPGMQYRQDIAERAAGRSTK
jgi:phosphoribosylamine---glycine ligase